MGILLRDPRPQFQTKFHIPKKGKDPFRHLIRDYMAMEAEKDDRQYGETLMAQPSLDRTRRWTIDDIERLGYKIKNPLWAA